MPRIVLCFILLLLAFPLYANDTNQIKHVIYVTLDGTRWQDIFSKDFFHKLKDKYGKGGIFYGEPGTKTTIEVASIPISLPSYQSQMAGSVQPCNGNLCARIGVVTLPENILHQLHLPKKDVASFSSWWTLDYAIEHITGTTYVNVGNTPVIDPEGSIDSVMMDLNLKQVYEHPPGLNRLDKYTFEHALHYFEKHRPRFLWISLIDADEAGHLGSLLLYHQVLAMYDNMLDKLFITLQRLNVEKETMVIVTTDHGRGNGIFWTSHGPQFPESKRTWAFVMNGELKPISHDGEIYHYSTLSMRPTIEAALGIV